jgi:acyl-CoA synthetase (AMP-forming)/AMP-acid ligase II
MVTDQLRIMARLHPDKCAFRNLDGGELSFGKWDSESNRLARGLTRAGVRKGDRVSIFLESDQVLRWVITYTAIHKAGAVAVPTNTRLAPRELETILSHAAPKVIVSGGHLLPVALDLAVELESLETVVSTGRPDGGLAFDWETFLSEDAREIASSVGPEDLADIMYTSGTTGTPRGVAVRHKALSFFPDVEPEWSGAYWMYGNPLFSFAGVGPIYLAMKGGMTCLYQPHFDPTQWIDAVERMRPVIVFVVPAMAQLLVAHPSFDDADLSSITMCFVGSAPLAAATLQRLRDRMPNATVSNAYGMSEAGGICSSSGDDADLHPGSVGRPSPPHEVRIVDDEDRELAAGEVGEVTVRSGGFEREYYNDPKATETTWSGGWLHTGDLGYVDADGYLYIAGRKKDVIIRGGHNIHAGDVEAVLYEYPDVVEAAVFALPHDVLGEDVAAAVVLGPGATIDADGLRAFVAERVADYKAPRRIFVLDELPHNATGKVLKRELPRLCAGEVIAG